MFEHDFLGEILDETAPTLDADRKRHASSILRQNVKMITTPAPEAVVKRCVVSSDFANWRTSLSNLRCCLQICS
ncbi:hypothetical protein QA645_40390 [Bradyrhizobium sp. CIAT3101]|uniref:hypothetical protein n=1 Tax=Bradyrhizobium sp. CIAT3101 TaxID=439387 RepID=UPI0024B1E32D|nr:hypothetical protein [Bradyrhizobium sp. CIAT3101]WFU80632.1 hypothetical protein QA645_40390 [Bradyrhizobium sp. CIAT3101]